MNEKSSSSDIGVEPGMRFDLTGKELRNYLNQFRKEKIPCPICQTDNWGTLETCFSNNEYKVIPDSISGREFENASDLDSREAKCSQGSYNFICGNCGFCLAFNAIFVASRFHAQAEAEKKNNIKNSS